MKVSKGDRMGQVNAVFPRNDEWMCSYEPHVFLDNEGNIDWRPCLNLWAVVEYITKYATKAPSGSRKMGEVLRDAVAEVRKYTPQEQERSVGWKSLQKFYSRMLGERDYSLFEAVHVGLGLPLVHSLMPVVSLPTSGARAWKTAAQLAEGGPDDAVEWSSKIDHFDNRLQLVRRRHVGTSAQAVATRKAREAEVRDLSFYEFYDKHRVERGRVQTPQKGVALMVTPSLSSDTASVVDARHEAYARMCVVAFWRLMPTVRRYAMIESAGLDCDVRRWGGSVAREEMLGET